MPKIWAVSALFAILALGCSSSSPPAAPAPPALTGDAAEATWSAHFDGQPLDMSASADGSIIVRLAAAPWLVRHAADGRPSRIEPQAALDWAAGFAAADDGSIYVAGTSQVPDAPDVSNVRVDHLAATGALLTSTSWALPNSAASDAELDSTTFGGITRAPNGDIVVLAISAARRAVVHLTVDGEPANLTVLPTLPSAPDTDFPNAQRLTVSSEQAFLIQGGSADLWLERADEVGNVDGAWSFQLAETGAENAVYAGGVAPAPGGGWFAAVGSGFPDPDSASSYYHRGIVRLSEDGRRIWGAGDFFEPRDMTSPDELRHASLAVLEESVLLALVTPSDPLNADDVSISTDKPHATLVRYSLKGDYARAWELGAVRDLAVLGPEAIALLETSDEQPNRYTLQRFDFAPLGVPPVADGAPCSVAGDCVSGACCGSSTGLFRVTCAATAGCAQNNYCTDSTQCRGTCLFNASGGNQGFCAEACQVSTDCAPNTACVAKQCIPTCTAAVDCPYRGTHCAAAKSTESAAVSVCTADVVLD